MKHFRIFFSKGFFSFECIQYAHHQSVCHHYTSTWLSTIHREWNSNNVFFCLAVSRWCIYLLTTITGRHKIFYIDITVLLCMYVVFIVSVYYVYGKRMRFQFLSFLFPWVFGLVWAFISNQRQSQCSSIHLYCEWGMQFLSISVCFVIRCLGFLGSDHHIHNTLWRLQN